MRKKKLILFFLIIIILLLLAYIWPNITGEITKIESDANNYENAIVKRVIDGDTIEIDDGERVRLLGINTPEKKKAYSTVAKDFLEEIVLNQEVQLLKDKTDKDQYDRKLRYLFFEDRLINIEIIENGYATTFMINGLKYENKFKIAEEFARNNELALWEKSKDKCSRCIILQELEPEIDYFILKNNCDFTCELINWSVKDDANHFFYPEKLLAYEEKKYISEKEVWNDNGDRFFLRDGKGNLVVFYSY